MVLWIRIHAALNYQNYRSESERVFKEYFLIFYVFPSTFFLHTQQDALACCCCVGWLVPTSCAEPPCGGNHAQMEKQERPKSPGGPSSRKRPERAVGCLRKID